jgi:hypothetical protein
MAASVDSRLGPRKTVTESPWLVFEGAAMSTVGFRPAQWGRLVAIAVLRAFAITTVLVAAYYLLPLDLLAESPLALVLVLELIALIAFATYQVRATARATYPGIRGSEGLAATTPLFLLMFATAYFVMATADPGNFNVHDLTRTDSLYFTVSVFSTVGFGDISATSQGAKLLVTTQMILNLLFLGLGIRVFLGAVKFARDRTTPVNGTAPPEGP